MLMQLNAVCRLLCTADVEQLVDAFPGQSIDFFGALRARVYDEKVRCVSARLEYVCVGVCVFVSVCASDPALAEARAMRTWQQAT